MYGCRARQASRRRKAAGEPTLPAADALFLKGKLTLTEMSSSPISVLTSGASHRNSVDSAPAIMSRSTRSLYLQRLAAAECPGCCRQNQRWADRCVKILMLPMNRSLMGLTSVEKMQTYENTRIAVDCITTFGVN